MFNLPKNEKVTRTNAFVGVFGIVCILIIAIFGNLYMTGPTQEQIAQNPILLTDFTSSIVTMVAVVGVFTMLMVFAMLYVVMRIELRLDLIEKK